MVTLTIELDDATYARIQAAAERAGTSPEAIVRDEMAVAFCENVTPEFDELVRGVIEEYRPLLQRLAQ